MKPLTVIVLVIATLAGLTVAKFVLHVIREKIAFSLRICGICYDYRHKLAFKFNKPPGRPFWLCASCADKKLGPFAQPSMIEKGILIPVEFDSPSTPR